ncbi:uncharacterized protein LOC119096421 [Pollicipes pollicipes]|uniref:uncharacterized protein LOC119096421 n=1 Tax=Pollicipes pollicipes TaxID=41117 RepID=UPI0018852D4D|nr:uncharacterized protein LOC119096421 [Pollicipes pollicipes]
MQVELMLQPEVVSRCLSLHPRDRVGFLHCVCEHEDRLGCPSALETSTAAPTTTSPPVAVDWSRSYSVSAGLCVVFLIMCVVIIALRVLRRRSEPQETSQSGTAARPAADSDPPPYDVVVQQPPPYLSLEPPPYSELDTDKCPAALACGRPGSGLASVITDRATATPDPEVGVSDPDATVSDPDATVSDPDVTVSGPEAAGRGLASESGAGGLDTAPEASPENRDGCAA